MALGDGKGKRGSTKGLGECGWWGNQVSRNTKCELAKGETRKRDVVGGGETWKHWTDLPVSSQTERSQKVNSIKRAQSKKKEER